MPKITIFFILLYKLKKYNTFFCQNFIYDAGCSSCTKYCVLRKFCGILLFAQNCAKLVAYDAEYCAKLVPLHAQNVAKKIALNTEI